MNLVGGIRKHWIHVLFALFLALGSLFAGPAPSAMAGDCGRPKCGSSGGGWRCSVSIDGNLAVTLHGEGTDGQCGF